MRAVTIPVDDRVWWRLAGIAEERGVSTSVLVTDLLHEAAFPKPTKTAEAPREPSQMPSREYHIPHLIRCGFTDHEIASWCHVSLDAVSVYRRNQKEAA